MHVIRAAAMGMCFGVRDALAAIESLSDPETVTVHGELVHNEMVLNRLRSRGFAMQPEGGRTNLPLTERVVITAHGVSERERARLRAAGKDLIDTTCPLVRRVHEAARQLERQGYFVLVIGKPDHVEVQGIVGDLEGYAIVPNVAAVRSYGIVKLGVVCQSTTTPDDAERILTAIGRANPGVPLRYLDTICRPTRDRQTALAELLDRVEALVVVGGRHSNNTRQLVRSAAERGLPVVHVQSAADLDGDWFRPFHVVGLTAGTSTLETTIDEVERVLRGLPTFEDEWDAPTMRIGRSGPAEFSGNH